MSIRERLDPDAAEIWKTYYVLAELHWWEADESSDSIRRDLACKEARRYRRMEHDTFRAFPGSRSELLKFKKLIFCGCACCGAFRSFGGAWYRRMVRWWRARRYLGKYMAECRQAGQAASWTAVAIERLLAGERDPAVLCERLQYDLALAFETILQGLENPKSLEWLLTD